MWDLNHPRCRTGPAEVRFSLHMIYSRSGLVTNPNRVDPLTLFGLGAESGLKAGLWRRHRRFWALRQSCVISP
jgi:hypothetical protein